MPVEKPNIPQNNNRATAGVLPALMGIEKKPGNRSPAGGVAVV
jgi:hypothetical protein